MAVPTITQLHWTIADLESLPDLQLVATLQPDDELTSPLLPEFKLKVSQIFE